MARMIGVIDGVSLDSSLDDVGGSGGDCSGRRDRLSGCSKWR